MATTLVDTAGSSLACGGAREKLSRMREELLTVAPIRTGLDGNNVADTVASDFEVDTFTAGFEAVEDALAHEDGELLEKAAEDGLFLRR